MCENLRRGAEERGIVLSLGLWMIGENKRSLLGEIR